MMMMIIIIIIIIMITMIIRLIYNNDEIMGNWQRQSEFLLNLSLLCWSLFLCSFLPLMVLHFQLALLILLVSRDQGWFDKPRLRNGNQTFNIWSLKKGLVFLAQEGVSWRVQLLFTRWKTFSGSKIFISMKNIELYNLKWFISSSIIGVFVPGCLVAAGLGDIGRGVLSFSL